MRVSKPQRNTKEQIRGFHIRMKALAFRLSREQGIPAGTPHEFPTVAMKRHSCEKAIAPQFRKEGPCSECEYEQGVAARLAQVIGPPASK